MLECPRDVYLDHKRYELSLIQNINTVNWNADFWSLCIIQTPNNIMSDIQNKRLKIIILHPDSQMRKRNMAANAYKTPGSGDK